MDLEVVKPCSAALSSLATIVGKSSHMYNVFTWMIVLLCLVNPVCSWMKLTLCLFLGIVNPLFISGYSYMYVCKMFARASVQLARWLHTVRERCRCVCCFPGDWKSHGLVWEPVFQVKFTYTICHYYLSFLSVSELWTVTITRRGSIHCPLPGDNN